MTAVNKAHSVSNDKANVIVVIRILEYVLPHASSGTCTTGNISPVLAALVRLVLRLVGNLLTIVLGLLVGVLGAVTQLILGLDFVLLAGVLLI